LEQVPPLVCGENLQTRADRELKQGNEWIDEPDPVHIMVARASDDPACLVIAGEEPVDD
jgi:hypothetical protein